MRGNLNALTRRVKRVATATERRMVAPTYGTVFYGSVSSCERIGETQEEHWQRIFAGQPEVAEQYEELRERGTKTIFFLPIVDEGSDLSVLPQGGTDERA